MYYPIESQARVVRSFLRVLVGVMGMVCIAAGAAYAEEGLGGEIPPISIDVAARPEQSLNAYHLFRDAARQVPNEALIPYDVNASLFADYTNKHRFFYLPPGTSMTYHPDDSFTFPVGTVLVKTFSHPLDARKPGGAERLLETRVLMHRAEGWVGYPYVWNAEQSDARLAVAGAQIPTQWTEADGTVRSIQYHVPNSNECKFCHTTDDVMAPIGTSARQLNRVTHGQGEPENQLHDWIRRGIVTASPENGSSIAVMPSWADEGTPVALRARAYLDSNCAHCHRPGGDAGPTGLDFRWSQQAPQAYGIYRKPTAAGPASRGYRYAIAPGHPERSLVLFRMGATAPGLLMPRTGRSVPHEEGLALISAWIGEMAVDFGTETVSASK